MGAERRCRFRREAPVGSRDDLAVQTVPRPALHVGRHQQFRLRLLRFHPDALPPPGPPDAARCPAAGRVERPFAGEENGKAETRRLTLLRTVAGENHPHRPVHRRSEVHSSRPSGIILSSRSASSIRTGRRSWSPCGGPSEPARLDAHLERRGARRRRHCDAFAGGGNDHQVRAVPHQPEAHLDHDHVVERLPRRDLPPACERRHHRIRRRRAHRALPRDRRRAA